MRTVIITQSPVGEPVSLAQARALCRLDQDTEDDLVRDLITAARLRIEQTLGLCLLTTGIREWRDAWGPASGAAVEGGRGLVLARGPLVSVTDIQVGDSQRRYLRLDPDHYAPLPGSWPAEVGTTSRAILQPTAPSAGLQIDYLAGFGDRPEQVPPSLRQGVLALVAWSHTHRDEAEAPISVAEPWLSAWRRVRM